MLLHLAMSHVSKRNVIFLIITNNGYFRVLYFYLCHSIKDLKLLVCKDTQFP